MLVLNFNYVMLFSLSKPPPPPNKSLLEVMARVYVGNLDSRVTKQDLEDEFRVFGVIRR